MTLLELLILSVALAMDTFAVGICYGLSMPKVIIKKAIIIGLYFGTRYKSKAEFAGGIILVLIGTRILFEHLGILVF